MYVSLHRAYTYGGSCLGKPEECLKDLSRGRLPLYSPFSSPKPAEDRSELKQLEFALHQLFDSKTPTLAATRYPELFYDKLRGETRWFASSSIQPVAGYCQVNEGPGKVRR